MLIISELTSKQQNGSNVNKIQVITFVKKNRSHVNKVCSFIAQQLNVAYLCG